MKRRKSVKAAGTADTAAAGNTSTLAVENIADGGPEPQLSATKKSRRRASSVYILEGTGTSLTRHRNSVEVGAGAGAGAGADGAPQSRSSASALFNISPEKESEHQPDSGSAAASRKPFQMFLPVEEAADSEAATATSSGLADEDSSTQTDVVAAFAPAETEAKTVSGEKAAPLFEHFLVVGMPQDVSLSRTYF